MRLGGAVVTHPRLFAGVYPCGIVYSDRARERHGDYLRLAFLPFRTLRIEWEPGITIPADLRAAIMRDAAGMEAKRGELFPVSSSGQCVRLGGALPTD